MIIAGTDTSSMTMFYLLKACQDDPILEQDLRAEVDHVVGEILLLNSIPTHARKELAQCVNAVQWSRPVNPCINTFA